MECFGKRELTYMRDLLAETGCNTALWSDEEVVREFFEDAPYGPEDVKAAMVDPDAEADLRMMLGLSY